MSYFTEMLKEFHQKFEQYQGPVDGVHYFHEIQLGHRLLCDELRELVDAFGEVGTSPQEISSWSGFFKELVDVQYVGFGMLLRLGVEPEVDDRFLQRHFQVHWDIAHDPERIRRERVPVFIGYWRNVHSAIRGYSIGWQLSQQASEADTVVKILAGPINRILNETFRLEQAMGINPFLLFERVHQNNLSKLVDGKLVKDPQGKVLKPPGYIPLDLSKDLARAWKGWI